MKSFSCFGKLVAAVVCSFVVGQAFGALPTNPDTTIGGKGYYKISSCTDLQSFSTKVNNGSTSINGIMVASFDCAGSTLTPIGNSSYKYSGTFDGNGFTIKNLNFGGSKYNGQYQYVGLFGITTIGAEIKDVFIEGAVIYSKVTEKINSGESDADADLKAGYAGGIVGRNEGATIHDCVVKNAEIWGAKGGDSKRSYSGGIVGYNVSGTIYNCSVTGGTIVETTEAVGGIAGYNA